MLETLRTLFAYDAWANARVLEALRSHQTANQKALNFLAHLLVSEKIWLLRLKGVDTSNINKSPDASLAACAAAFDEMRGAFADYVGSIKEEELDARVTYRNFKGAEFHTPVKDILMHVAFHGTYHRGQIALAMRAESMTPVDTDFITFIRENGAA